MAYRVLIDENVDPSTAELLRDRGHEAIHVAGLSERDRRDEPFALDGFVCPLPEKDTTVVANDEIDRDNRYMSNDRLPVVLWNPADGAMPVPHRPKD